MNEWLAFSLILLGIWLVIWLIKPSIRKEMFWASVLTAPFGLTEPLFVPEYWTPPSLFNLNIRTGFDIESIIFCFAVGGIGAVLYETFFEFKHVKINKQAQIRKHHVLGLLSPFIVFIFLHALTNINPIYSSSIAMAVGAIATVLCRSDLGEKILAGAFMFLMLYFLFFLTFNLVYPGAVEQIWNLKAISGILFFGIPIEELIFAFTFGALWSSYYEHILWYKLVKKQNLKQATKTF